MGRNKHLRKVIKAKLRNIQDHIDKINSELDKPEPNIGLIRKWQKDIKGFEKEVSKYTAKLPGRKQK